MGKGEGHVGGSGGWSFEPTSNRALKLRQADQRITYLDTIEICLSEPAVVEHSVPY